MEVGAILDAGSSPSCSNRPPAANHHHPNRNLAVVLEAAAAEEAVSAAACWDIAGAALVGGMEVAEMAETRQLIPTNSDR